MTIETVKKTADAGPFTIWQKLNPVWWLQGPDGWVVPEYNNGTPYLPDVTNVWLRRFYWFICRNPLMNFVGFVVGVEDKSYSATGSAPVMRTTGRDCEPQQVGWRWAILMLPFSITACVATILLATAAWFLSAWLWYPVICFAMRIAGPLPYISYWGPLIGTGRFVEFYLGWRPHSGGFGLKFVIPKEHASQQVLAEGE